MSDRPRGNGWWLAANGKWYPPEDAPEPAPAPPPPPSEPPADGWWLASDGNWYPPESRNPAAAAAPPAGAAAGWWQASDGNWYPPEARPGEAQRPQPGWWLASDGAWYPPESRPQPVTVAAPPAAEQATARIGPGMSTALRFFLYGTALLSLLAAALTVNEVVQFNEFADGGPAAGLIDAENASESASSWLAVAFLATGILFIAWLHQAYKAIVALGAEGRRWSPGWAIGGWFIPFANLVIPKLVINEVDRVSASGPPLTGTEWKNTHILTVGSFWWGAFVFGAVGLAVGSAISGAQLEADVFDAGVYRAGLVISAAAYGLYALAALLAARVVRAIGSRLDHRRSSTGTA